MSTPHRRPTELPVTFAGRPVKPLALALMCATAVIFVINVVDAGAFGPSAWGDVFAGVAAAVVVVLAVGWAARWQAAAELGLLLAAGLWTGRAVALVLLHGAGEWQAYLSGCWAVAAGGAFLLERAYQHTPRGGP